MKAARKKPTAAKLRSWRVSIIRKRGQYLGTVEAPNEKAAEAAAERRAAPAAGRERAGLARYYGPHPQTRRPPLASDEWNDDTVSERPDPPGGGGPERLGAGRAASSGYCERKPASRFLI